MYIYIYAFRGRDNQFPVLYFVCSKQFEFHVAFVVRSVRFYWRIGVKPTISRVEGVEAVVFHHPVLRTDT